MYCTKCGNEQQDGQAFCPKCGTKYLVSSSETTKEGPAYGDESETVHSKEEAKANNGNGQPASPEAVEPNLAAGSQQENSSENVEEVCELSAEEQNTYNLWMNILKWGGIAMAGIVCFFPNSFSLAHVLLCLIVMSAWGKKEKTLSTIKKMKLKTLACVGIFAFLLLYNNSGSYSSGSSGGGDVLERAYKNGYDYGYQCSSFSKITSGQIQAAFNEEYDTQGDDIEHAKKVYQEFERGARKGYSEGKRVYGN